MCASALALNGATAVVSVLFRDEPDVFPEHWRSDPISASAVPLPAEEVNRSLTVVARAMGRYPTSLLRENLRRVFVMHSLRFYGLEYGGTNSSDTVYIANQGARRGYTDGYLERAFHHEFSSILMRNHPDKFDWTAWQAANPEGFGYAAGGTEAVRSGRANTFYDRRFLAQGFLCEYATSSIEEDFNMYAEGLMSGSRRFWAAVENYPAVAKKAELAMRFYAALDPSLNAETLRSFKTDTARD